MKPKCYSYSRFSSPEQKKGDSLRRQNEYAEKWAQKNGFELDDTLRMQDEGLSAFRGAHITRGALGQYLDLVEKFITLDIVGLGRLHELNRPIRLTK